MNEKARAPQALSGECGQSDASASGGVGKAGKGPRQGRALRRARTITLLAVFAAVLASLAFDSGLGTPSSFGIGEFFLLCPLGGLEAFLASKAFLPVTAISLAVVLLLALLFGRGWCAWGCPVPPIRRFFKREPKFGGIGSGEGPNACETGRSVQVGSRDGASSCGALCGGAPASRSGKLGRVRLAHVGRDPRTWTLVAVLLAAFVAGFPLFCLVCPIGLTFGTVGSLWHLIVDKQVTMSVVVFPVALAVEVLLYRKWCMNLCPIAGLLNVFGQAAVLFRPRINQASCLREDGTPCTVCTAVCTERIDMHDFDGSVQLGDCTRCGECARACPTGSISFGVAAAPAVVQVVEGDAGSHLGACDGASAAGTTV